MPRHPNGPSPARPHNRRLVRRRLRSLDDVRAVEALTPEVLRPADTVLGCLRAVANEVPDKAAIVLVEPPDLLEPAQEVTFAELVTDIEAAANLFHEIADGVPSAVGVMLPMLPEGLAALWGAQTAGVGIPLNPFLELGGLARILVDTGATTLVTLRDVLEPKGGISVLQELVPSLRRVLYADDSDPADGLAHALDAHRDGLRFAPDDDPWRDAMLMPTGGTTGAPKLVRMSQAGQLAVSWNVAALMGNEQDGVTAHGMPNFHCGGTISLGLRTLMFGGTLLTLTRDGFRTPAVVQAFWDIARRFGVTSVLATPTTALALLHGEGSSEGCRVRDFHVGGSALPMDLVRSFHDRFGIWLRENWGMTELHGTTTGHFNDDAMPRVGSAGRPLPFVRVKAVILDEEGRWLRDCATGERGVLLTGTPTTMSGYVDETLDADYFPKGMPDDLPHGWRWGNTGDLGSVDQDGYVWIFGRAKDLIIRGGHNIDPKEVEDALASHPAVHVAAAVGRPDPAKGELPIAYVELREGSSATPEELLAYCREHVQERAAVPVDLVVLHRMPLTPVGKVAKPRLRADALVGLVEAQVAALGAKASVLLDESGSRLGVDVTVHGDADQVDAVCAALRGYHFDARVHFEDES